MRWHIITTALSPRFSTSISAPQWFSQNSALPSGFSSKCTSMYSCGKPTSSWSAFTIAVTSSPSIFISRFMRRV